jgi:hypothetical protein
MRKNKKHTQTNAQRVFKTSSIICERPDGMTMDEYKAIRKPQSRAIKILFPRAANPRIASQMRPALKSEHLQQQVHTAKLIKYGHLKNIGDEAEENQNKLSITDVGGWFTEQWNNIRDKFGRNKG